MKKLRYVGEARRLSYVPFFFTLKFLLHQVTFRETRSSENRLMRIGLKSCFLSSFHMPVVMLLFTLICMMAHIYELLFIQLNT